MATTPTLQERRRAAIQSIESRGSGGYSAIGPYNEKLGRALGAYQIMEANIPQWSQEALGRKVSSMEFLKSPEIQDAIFDYKFGNYAKKFGEQGAAEAWFAGPGGVGKSGRKDVLGTTVGGYGQRYLDALTGGGAALPREMFEPGASEYRSQIPAQIPLVELTPIQQRARSIFGDQVAATPTGNMSVQERARAIFGTPQQAPAYTPGVSGPVVPTIAYGTGAGETPYPVAAPEGAFDITRSMSSEYTPILGDVGRSLTGQGPSPGASMLPEETPLRGAVGRVIDVGLGAASGLGAGMSGAAGLVGDVARGLGMETGRAERLATDVMAMPEAFAGSIGSVAQPVRGAQVGISRAARAPIYEDEAVAAAQRLRQGLREVPEAPQALPGAAQVVDEAAGPALPASEVLQPAIGTTEAESKMRRLIARAANNQKGAREELAAMAKVDPEAAAAAERLGIGAPVDVFAENALVRQAAGIVRGVKGSDAAVEWEDTFNAAQQRAAELMRAEGATLDLSTQSENVRTALTSSIDKLRSEGSALFDDVKGKLPKSERVQPAESTKAVNSIIEEIGGTEALTGAERGLFNAITSDEGMTYGRLMREKEQIGRAAFKNSGPYADADQRTMTRLYKALSDDQRNFVATHADEATLRDLDNANALWSTAKDLEGKLVAGFGKDGEGSIAPKITSAITTGAKGGIAGLNRVLDVVPENLRREAILTGIETLSQAKSGQGGFSFADYSKLYRGLRNNTQVYNRVAKEIGPDSERMLRDLYEVSVRMDRAAQAVPRTGMANQALIGESLLSRVLDSSVGGALKTSIGAAGGGLVGGPLGAAAGAAAGSSLKIGGKRARTVGAMLNSPEFQKLATEAATGSIAPTTVERVIKSPGYKAWAKSVQIKDPEGWLMNTIAAQQAAQGVQE